MSDLLLTTQERRRFAEYLMREAWSSDQIIAQMAKMGPHGEMLSKRERAFSAACKLIADRLQRTEDMTLQSGGTQET